MKRLHLGLAILAIAFLGHVSAQGPDSPLKGKWVITYDLTSGKQSTEEIDIQDIAGGKVMGKAGKKDLEGELKGTILTLKGTRKDCEIYLDSADAPKLGIGVEQLQMLRHAAKL